MVKFEGETGISLKLVIDWISKNFYISDSEAKRYFIESILKLVTIDELAAKIAELLFNGNVKDKWNG